MGLDLSPLPKKKKKMFTLSPLFRQIKNTIGVWEILHTEVGPTRSTVQIFRKGQIRSGWAFLFALFPFSMPLVTEIRWKIRRETSWFVRSKSTTYNVRLPHTKAFQDPVLNYLILRLLQPKNNSITIFFFFFWFRGLTVTEFVWVWIRE